MTNNLTIAMAQINVKVGDIHGNTEKIIRACQQAEKDFNAQLIVFPELALTGYPPEDLLLRPDFHRQIERAMEEVAVYSQRIDLLLGYPQLTSHGLYNAAAWFHNGNIIANYHKKSLPNYSVFDEKRYFKADSDVLVLKHLGINIGVNICEDLWAGDPCQQAVANGAQLLIVINASPYRYDKAKQREALLVKRINQFTIPIMYVHMIGGQDEFVFDGGSMIFNKQGQLCHHGGFFVESLTPVVISPEGEILSTNENNSTDITTEENIYQALCLGVKDYLHKNGFSGALVGLSGGIDSALTLTIAADALGANNVEAVLMPSEYTAQMSIDDGEQLTKNLNVKSTTIAIDDTLAAFNDSLYERFADYSRDVTEENLQSRIRGTLLMAISNKTGKLVLTTGNKSEYAVGYATLYGDMAGGFAVLKDVPKTMVYRLANYRNSINKVIPQRIITRAPSAELAPGQIDEDLLPPYEILDEIIELYVVQDKALSEIVAQGFDKDMVVDVLNRIDKNEYKRRQAPVGVRISSRAFGRDRRYPITSGFKQEQ